MHQGTMRVWALAAVSLVACDGLKLKTETKTDPDVLRCAADPSDEGCDALFAAWCEKYPNDSQYCRSDAGGAQDADAPDASANDAATEDAGEPDAGCTCPGNTPVCLDDGSCAVCTTEDTTACPSDQPLCDAANTCVACLENADCQEESAPVCNDGACVPCSNDEGCADRDQICDVSTGQCEGCTLAREAERCGDNSCDPQALTCTGTRRGSVTICKACVADSECEADHRCIPMYFGTGATRVELGGRCMPRAAAGCARPYAAPRIARESLSRAAVDEYCGIAEDSTSCEAILSLIEAVQCTRGGENTCPGSGALCRSVNSVANSCTYACESSADCPSRFPCPSSGTDRYCGK